ncbi:MAG: hypothetical protein WCB15_17005 [Desulfobacterales bacterium]
MFRHSEAVKLPVGGRVFESELTARSREPWSKGRNGDGTFITHNSLAFDVHLTPFFCPSSARGRFEQLAELRVLSVTVIRFTPVEKSMRPSLKGPETV